MQKIKTIIFDFDNTLYQGEKTFCDNWTKACVNQINYFFKNLNDKQKIELYKKYDVPYEFDENLMQGKPGAYALKIVTGEGYSIDDWLRYWHENVYLENWTYVTKIIENDMLKELSGSYKLYIVSNSPMEQINAYADHLNINLNLFKNIFANFDLRWKDGVEKTVYYKKIMELQGNLPDEYLVIGDSLSSDIEPAIKLGMNTLYINNQEWDYNNIFYELKKLNTREN